MKKRKALVQKKWGVPVGSVRAAQAAGQSTGRTSGSLSTQSPPAAISTANISSPQRSNRLGPMPLHCASSASVSG
jgi:hypothetical protein